MGREDEEAGAGRVWERGQTWCGSAPREGGREAGLGLRKGAEAAERLGAHVRRQSPVSPGIACFGVPATLSHWLRASPGGRVRMQTQG